MTLIRRIVVSGRVQGVSFRAFVEDQALMLGVEGWVRNRRVGSVEAVFAGSDEVVGRIVEACRRGPPAARVDAVEESAATDADLDLRRPGDVFSVLPTV